MIEIVSKALSTIFFHVVVSFIAIFSFSVPYLHIACLHTFFLVVHTLLLHGSASTTKHRL